MFDQTSFMTQTGSCVRKTFAPVTQLRCTSHQSHNNSDKPKSALDASCVKPNTMKSADQVLNTKVVGSHYDKEFVNNHEFYRLYLAPYQSEDDLTPIASHGSQISPMDTSPDQLESQLTCGQLDHVFRKRNFIYLHDHTYSKAKHTYAKARCTYAKAMRQLPDILSNKPQKCVVHHETRTLPTVCCLVQILRHTPLLHLKEKSEMSKLMVIVNNAVSSTTQDDLHSALNQLFKILIETSSNGQYLTLLDYFLHSCSEMITFDLKIQVQLVCKLCHKGLFTGEVYIIKYLSHPKTTIFLLVTQLVII